MNNRIVQCILLSLIIITPLYAQKIIIENEEGEGIRGVLVSTDRNEVSISNAVGVVQLNPEAKSFSFSHVNYEAVEYTNEQLTAVIVLQQKIQSLQEVIVGANKWEEVKSEVPQQILEIQKKEAEFALPQTTADMLGNTGEVFIQKSQMGGGSPMIRGFAANQVLLVVDGVRMNNAIYRSGNLQNSISIDPYSISSAEVIFGPGSVMYGSDALGGVMDFHTTLPEYAERSKKLFYGDAQLKYASAMNENTANVHFNLASQKLAWTSTVSFSSFDDLKSGGWFPSEDYQFGNKLFLVSTDENGVDQLDTNPNQLRQSPSGYQQLNTLQKVAFKVNDQLELMYTFSFSNTSSIPRYDRLTELNPIMSNGAYMEVTMEDVIEINSTSLITTYGTTTPKFAEWEYGPQYWMMNNIRLIAQQNRSWYDNLSLIVGHQKVKEDRFFRKFNDTKRNESYVSLELFHLNMDVNKEISKKASLFYGIEGTYNDVQSSAIGKNILTGEVNKALPRYAGGGSQMTTLAGYITGKYKLTNHLVGTAGLRYTETFIKADYTDEASKTLHLPYDQLNTQVGSITGAIGLAYHPDNWQLNTQFAKGFKAPNIDDIAKVYNPSKDDLVIPNPQLKPTDVYTLDATVIHYFGDKLRVGANAYYSWLTNIMVRGPSTFLGMDSVFIEGDEYAVTSLQNADQARIWGVSAHVFYHFTEYLHLKGTYTYTNGRELITDAPLRHVPPFFGRLTLGYKKQKLHLALVGNYSGGIAYDALAPIEQTKPYLYSKEGALPWWTLGFNSSYRLTNYLECHFTVDNIFDLAYRTYSSGINSPGRNFGIAIKGYF
ncbi:TonB-dependent receptor plug domain-containing protein [Flammeovirga agarivorans]|uniref:TonB-dependent receptor n=1 Tax=Flammeovirga agarivorans TaxID=2726742 RepID=A0A7X8SKE9_9BACT|nr:TonB-dependent receptor [Flammeovirga agarivorans]NLR91795.1 TonB-dependent receptor [Flammeovirga agarivorans]